MLKEIDELVGKEAALFKEGDDSNADEIWRGEIIAFVQTNRVPKLLMVNQANGETYCLAFRPESSPRNKDRRL
jgi:hypothetical protein